MVPEQLLTHKAEWVRKVAKYLQRNSEYYIIDQFTSSYPILSLRKCNNPQKPRYKKVEIFKSDFRRSYYELRFEGKQWCTFTSIKKLLQTLHKMK